MGDIFELTDAEVASVLEISRAAYRQRLRRARVAVIAFTRSHCGIASDTNACSCDRRVAAAMQSGRIVKGRSAFGLEGRIPTDLATLRRRVTHLEHGRAASALMRSNPNFSTNIKDLVLHLIDRDKASS